jgi:purine/pyrimidine-nucleoside phosphorylase
VSSYYFHSISFVTDCLIGWSHTAALLLPRRRTPACDLKSRHFCAPVPLVCGTAFKPFSSSIMPTLQIDQASVTTQANVYFGGKCISHSLTLPGGIKKSVGVILPATLTFNTGAAEIMECVGGACDYKLAGSTVWVTSTVGEKFDVPGNSKFDIRVADGHEAYHYICHFA